MEQLPQKELASIQETMNEISQALAKRMQPLVESLQLLQKQWNRLTSQWVEPIQGLKLALLKIAQSSAERKRIAQAFQACDLWLAPSMIGLTDKVVQLYYEGKKQVIPSIIARYYRRNNYAILRKTVSNWESNSFFRPRMGIIYDAVEAHTNGKYTLSVPALLPHIEGIAVEIVEKYNLPKLDYPLIYRENAHGKSGEKTYPGRVFAHVGMSELNFEEWVAVESLLYYLEGTFYLSPRRVGKKLKDFAASRILNRHSILHGANTRYATHMNSLRCFLALDVLSLIDGGESK